MASLISEPELITETPVPLNSRAFWRFTLLGGLDLFALSLWLGGLVAIGAIVAPVAFAAVRGAPEFAGNTAGQSLFAGSILGGSLKIFNYLTYPCGILMVIVNVRRRCNARAIIAAVLTIISLMLGFGAFPALNHARSTGDMARFESIHLLYVDASYVQMALLLIYLILTARPPKRLSI